MAATIHAALALACLAPLATAQEEPMPGPPAPVAATEDEPTLLEFALGEGVVAVVGRKLIRRNDVLSAFETGAFERDEPALAEARRSSDPDVRQRGHFRVLVELLRELLKAEGGSNQGYSQETIDAIVSDRMRELQRDAGGAVAASQLLQRSGYDPESYSARQESMLLSRTWRQSVIGLAPSPTGRISVDRFVSPGILQLEYQRRLESRNAEERASIGQQPQRYVLEQVILGLYEYREMQRARDVAERVKAEVLSGALTMEEAARQFTLPQNRIADWQVDPLTAGQVRNLSQRLYGGDALAEWVLAAAPGDVSDPFLLSISEGGPPKPAALVVFRLAEVRAARDATALVDPGLQDRLRRAVQDAWDEVRVERALVDVLEATYVHPPELRRNLLRQVGRPGEPGDAPPGAR